MPLHPRRVLSSASLVAMSVAAVVALLVLPGWFARESTSGPDRTPRPTPPSQEADPVGTRNWTALDCPGHDVGCRVPTILNLGGARFLHGHSHRQAVDQGNPMTRTLVRTISPAGGRRWVLVGADDASASSQLSIKLGNRSSQSIPPGTLTMLSVPGKRRPVQVRVADYGRSNGREVLRIEEYDALD